LRLASRELQKLDNAENPKPETTGLPPDYVRAVTAALGSWPDKPLSPEELDRKLGDDLKLAADRHGMTVKQILQTLLATFASLDSESEIESEEMYEPENNSGNATSDEAEERAIGDGDRG
jgi:hypothetical protein